MRAERFSSLMFKRADERQGFFHSSCSVHVVCVCVCVCVCVHLSTIILTTVRKQANDTHFLSSLYLHPLIAHRHYMGGLKYLNRINNS